MAITLSDRFLAEIKKNVNAPNVVIELELDGGTRRFGFHGRNTIPSTQFKADGTYGADGTVFAAGDTELESFSVMPALKSVSSLQNKLDMKNGFSTRGVLSVVITGSPNFTGLLMDEYLKNRRVIRKDGFLESGFSYADYASTFSGVIVDWSRRGDDLTITVSDDLVDASKKIPVENSTKTQSMDFIDRHPVDIMTGILLAGLGIPASSVDSLKFASERDLWLQGWRFARVLTEPREANVYLNELQVETNSFIVHDGEKISFKVFAPPVPGQTIEEWNDDNNILKDSLSLRSGYRDGFFNRVVVYYDYDESGSDGEENFGSVHIAADASSQDGTEWNEVSTRTIKSRWIKNLAFSQTANISGVRVYHVSGNNGTGTGTLTFAYSQSGSMVQWSPPGEGVGEAVKLTEDGRFTVWGPDRTKYARILVEAASLQASNRTDTVTVYPLSGDKMASILAGKILSRYRDPAAAVSFEIDLNNAAWGSAFIKPTDMKDITTEEVCGKGKGAWFKERVMLTSVRPDYSVHKVSVEAVQTKMHRRYGFITGPGTPDYPYATASQREYGFIGGPDNMVNGGVAAGYYIW